jgi:hypothetical protein
MVLNRNSQAEKIQLIFCNNQSYIRLLLQLSYTLNGIILLKIHVYGVLLVQLVAKFCRRAALVVAVTV